jgi:hypothetical protein
MAVKYNAFGSKERKKALKLIINVTSATAIILKHGCILLY